MTDISAAPPAEVDVTAVMITYNSGDDIGDAVRALEARLEKVSAEILVVDNASSDDTTTVAADVLTRGRVIANETNLGYARAANVGLRQARSRYTLIMNDDAQLEGDAIQVMIDVLETSPDIGLVGPRIVDAHGRPTHSARTTYPGVKEELSRIKDLILRRRTTTEYPGQDRPVEVAWLVGACVLGPTDLLRRVGGFNENFFLYGEDIDLGRRLRELGLRSMTVPAATCTHVGGVATEKSHSDDARIRRQIAGRDVYYRLWLSGLERGLVYLRRAFGWNGQPQRLKTFLPMAFGGGPSLRQARFPEPLVQDV
jgi:N-acetylglucosaminyl-diphospho-decaprenol L-rhamnosyltransferase